jgi:peptidyl-dipeptidase Dcp
MTTEYLAAALLDHGLAPAEAGRGAHRWPWPSKPPRCTEGRRGFAPVPPRYHSTYFSHVFSGIAYSAGYYSYIWAEVLDADSVEWFKQHGGLTRRTATVSVRPCSSRGGSEEALMTLFRNFTGRRSKGIFQREKERLIIEPLLK